ncbi:MAG: ABC transporter ATP-binding protein [Promethearchaeota archaeon]
MNKSKDFIKEFFNNTIQILLKNVKKTYKTDNLTVNALNGVNIKIKKESFKMILGPSGCGKTTLLNVIGGLDVPDSGNILINFGEEEGGFKDITKFTKNQLTLYRRKKIGIIFQFYNLIPILTALENVELTARFSNIPNPTEASKALLERFDMGDILNRYPHQLSGGEQQRVAIARALIKDPLIILADEPTGNLDTKRSMEIYQLLKSLSEQDGKTVLIVTHDEDMAYKFSKEHVHIRDGRIIEDEQKWHQDVYQESMQIDKEVEK